MSVLLIILGILMMAASGFCLFHPVTSALTLGWLFGIMMIVSGAMSIYREFGREKKSVWNIIFGILSLLAGCFVAYNFVGNMIAVNLMVIVMGITFLLNGITLIMLSFELRRVDRGWWITLLGGVLSVMVSSLVLVNPVTGLLALELSYAVSFMSQGICLIALGIHAAGEA